MENTNKLYECSECGNNLLTEDGKYVRMYMPRSQGPTLYRPMGSQCSQQCYDVAQKKQIDRMNKISKQLE